MSPVLACPKAQGSSGQQFGCLPSFKLGSHSMSLCKLGFHVCGSDRKYLQKSCLC